MFYRNSNPRPYRWPTNALPLVHLTLTSSLFTTFWLLYTDRLFWTDRFLYRPIVLVQTEVEVYRKLSPNKPLITDPEIDWEETTYLNLILQHVCTVLVLIITFIANEICIRFRVLYYTLFKYKPLCHLYIFKRYMPHVYLRINTWCFFSLLKTDELRNRTINLHNLLNISE